MIKIIRGEDAGIPRKITIGKAAKIRKQIILENEVWDISSGRELSAKELETLLQLFPAAHAWLARKKDHGRADAALVALCGAHQMALTGAKHAA